MPRRTKENQRIYEANTINFANALLSGTGYYTEKSRNCGNGYFNIRNAQGEYLHACLTGAELSREAGKVAEQRRPQGR